MPYSFAKLYRLLPPIGLMVMIAAASGCSAADDMSAEEVSGATDGRAEALSPTTSVCGLDVLPSPSRPFEDPCGQGELILDGPLASVSPSGLSASDTFHLPEAGRVCISVGENGARVHVNGNPVMPRPSTTEGDPMQHFSLELGAGTHDLRVGGATEVEVRTSRIRPGQATVFGQNGIVELTGVAVDHPMFSPNGDGYHDTALFNADNFPWHMPGEKSGHFDYFLNWEWTVIDAETCQSYGVILHGTTQVNSPTNVQVLWDGSDPRAASSVSALGGGSISGPAIPDGSYIYQYRSDLMRSDGLWIDTVVSHPHGVLVNSQSNRWPNSFGGTHTLSTHTLSTHTAGANGLSNDKLIVGCDPRVDEFDCACPEDQLEENTSCSYAMSSNLATFDDPADLPNGFITSSYNSETGRWTVVADMRDFNAGGLVPQTNGDYADIAELQQFVKNLTGVPADQTGNRLFNFDYIQLGYATPVFEGKPVRGFNHFLLDVITDQTGSLQIGSSTYDLPALFANGDPNIPAAYDILDERDGDECYHNGNTDGKTQVEGRSCTELRMANLDPGASDLGIYRIKTRIFEMVVDGRTTTREYYCPGSGLDCGIRTFQRFADEIRISREHYHEDGSQLVAGPIDERIFTDLPAVVVETDRYFDNGGSDDSHDGVCSRAELGRANMEIPLDSADGSLPSTCIINGIY